MFLSFRLLHPSKLPTLLTLFVREGLGILAIMKMRRILHFLPGYSYRPVKKKT